MRPDPGPPTAWRAAASTIAAATLALAAIAASLAMSPIRGADAFALPKEFIVLAGAGIAMLVLALADPREPADVVDVAAATLVTALALGAVGANSPYAALRGWSLDLAGLLAFCAARRARSRHARAVVVVGWAIAVVLLCVIALAESHGVIASLAYGTRSPGATLGNRNRLAHLLALAVIGVAPYLLLQESRRSVLAVGTLLVGVSVHVIVVTRCRGAWVALIAGSLALGLVTILRAKGRLDGPAVARRATVGAFLLLAAISSAALIPNVLRWDASSTYSTALDRLVDVRTGSGHGRLGQLRASLPLASIRPLQGLGPGNWATRYVKVPYDVPGFMDAEFAGSERLPLSDWTALAAEGGILSCLALLAFVAVVSLELGRPWWRARTFPEGLALVGPLAVGAVVSATVDPLAQTPVPLLLLASALGCAVQAAAAPAGHQGRGRGAALRLATCCLYLPAVSWLTALAWQRVRLPIVAAVAESPADLSVRLEPLTARIDEYAVLAHMYFVEGDCGSMRDVWDATRKRYPNAPTPGWAGSACERRSARVRRFRPERVRGERAGVHHASAVPTASHGGIP